MCKKAFRIFLFVFLGILLFSYSSADEGMWLLESIGQLPTDSLKALGLKLNPAEIYTAGGGGISDAIAKVNGSSGSFVSPRGLIVTNHHVAFSAIQRLSTVEHNYLRDGFYAEAKEQELPTISYYVDVPKHFKDVTSRFHSVLNDRMSDLKRQQAVEEISKKIIREAEQNKDIKAEVISAFGGCRYYLVTYFRIRDIRLVYAPPRSVGDYGGEIDNWMWPRHAGDFTFFRAYVSPGGKAAEYSKDNVPYDSKTFLKLSSAGIKEGDFVMLIGFPRKTSRYECSYSIDQVINHDYPLDIRTRQDLIAILEKASSMDSSVAIRLSSRINGLYNYLKKHQGELEGFRKSDILLKKTEEERTLEKFINDDPGRKKKFGRILAELDSLYQENKKLQDKDFVMSWMTSECSFLNFASTIYKWSLEKKKDDEKGSQVIRIGIPWRPESGWWIPRLIWFLQ